MNENLFINLKKYRPRDGHTPLENFITEAFAWILNYNTSLLIFLFVNSFQYSCFAQSQYALLPNGKKVILYEDKTWDYYEGLSYEFDFDQLSDNQIPDFLRQEIKIDKAKLKTAIEMYLQGWRYTMPRPKSKKAEWGYKDGRTTWWNGYWYNEKTLEYSRTTPEEQANGYYDGDEQDERNSWRNGGSPRNPNVYEWLLSSSNGIKPNSSSTPKSKSYQSRNFRFN